MAKNEGHGQKKQIRKMTTGLTGLRCGTINELCSVAVTTGELMLRRTNKQKFDFNINMFHTEELLKLM